MSTPDAVSSPDLDWGNFSSGGPWVLDRDAIEWSRVAVVLRRMAQREVPDLVRNRRVPPVGRLFQVVTAFAVALASWWVKKKRNRFATTEESRAYLSLRLRTAIEKLGATYIKLAQIISSGEGLFPAELVDEFLANKIRDHDHAAGLVQRLRQMLGHKPNPLSRMSLGMPKKREIMNRDDCRPIKRKGNEIGLVVERRLVTQTALIKCSCLPCPHQPPHHRHAAEHPTP